MQELDTYDLVKQKLEDIGVEQLKLLKEPLLIQLKTYRIYECYMIYIENGYLNYFDGKNFRKVNFNRVLTISE